MTVNLKTLLGVLYEKYPQTVKLLSNLLLFLNVLHPPTCGSSSTGPPSSRGATTASLRLLHGATNAVTPPSRGATNVDSSTSQGTSSSTWQALRPLPNAIPLNPDCSLPPPNTITQLGINQWTESVMGCPEGMADSCESMTQNARTLVTSMLDLFITCLKIYESEACKITGENKHLKILEAESVTHMRQCDERTQRLRADKLKTEKRLSECPQSGSHNYGLSNRSDNRVPTSLVTQNSMYFPGYFQVKAMKSKVNITLNQCLCW